MGNEILRGWDGQIAVERTSGAGTLQSDRTDSGTIGAMTNRLVGDSAHVRGKLSQRVRGKAEPTGLPCSCANGGTYRRGGPSGAPCEVCGGTRGA